MRWLPMLCALSCLLTANPAEAQQCYPSCRAGYLCHMGQCISACNPPCPAGQQCVEGRMCAYPQAAGRTVIQPMIAPSTHLTPIVSRTGGPGWSFGAGAWGIANIVIALGSATATVFADDEEPQGLIGGAATLYLAAASPFVVMGGNSADAHGGTAFEVIGWINYGLGVALGIVLSSLQLAGSGPDEGPFHFIPMGFLSVANAMFAADAFHSGGTANRTRAANDAPSFGLMVSPSSNGLRVGLRGGF